MSLPDIDIDFCERRRGEVIEYVTRKYGRENVAQIITFGTMKAKAVVRDVGRVLEMPFADVDKVAKQIPADARHDARQGARGERRRSGRWSRATRRSRSCCAVARRLEGMTRHASVHAAGVVIAPKAITEYAPLYKGARDEIVTQWSMKEIERIGLLKMDFLGLSTLTLIDDAIEEIERTDRRSSSTSTRVPLDDAKTYQIFQDGQTYGIFQFESSGMRDILRKAKPQRLEDLIALNALYRPGPLRSGMVDDFIARKQGKTEVKYELPQLEPILARDLRRHRLPGTGDADLERARRLHARRGRHPAQGDGQEEPRGDGEACAASSSTARRRTGITEKKAGARSST